MVASQWLIVAAKHLLQTTGLQGAIRGAAAKGEHIKGGK
jgi:hypothetical protein